MAQKLVFDKLKTKQSELQITFDGINYESYNVNSLKANGLEIPDTCNNFDNIKIKDKDNNEIDEFYYLLKDFSNSFYKNSKVKRIKINNNITSIGDHAFWNDSRLISIIIPDSVTSIGSWAFIGCCNLTDMKISEDNQYFTVENQVLFNKNKSTLIYYFNPSSTYEIPNSVTSIGSWAFYSYSSLTSIIIPDSVTSIGDCAFNNCNNLTSITIPEGVTSIGNYAFQNCINLTSITIPNSITHLGTGFIAYTNNISIKYKGTEEQWASLIANNRYWNNYLSSYSIIYNYDENEETGSVDVTITVPDEP